MKKIFTISTYLFFINYAFAQQLTYSKVLYDTLSSGLQVTGVVKSFHKGYIIIGASPYGEQQGLIMKVDTLGHYVAGNRISHYTNGTQPIVSFYQTVTTVDSNYALCGSVYDSATNFHRGMIIKFNDNGAILWAKQYAFSNASLTLTSLNQTNDSGFVICGYQTISNISHEFVAKTDKNGALQWNKVINASGTANDQATSVIQLPDSTIMLTGYHGGSPNSAFVTKLSKNGAVLFSKQYLSNNSNPVKSSDIVLKNNNPYLLINDGNNSLVKIDLSGNMLWRKTYPGSPYYNNFLNQPIYTRLHVSFNNGFYFNSPGSYNNNFFKTDSLGNYQSSSSTLLSSSVNVVQANDSGFFIIGNGPGLGAKSVYGSNNAPQIGIIKTDTSGTAINSCINHGFESHPSDSFIVSNILALTSGNAVESVLSLNSQTFYFETRTGCIDFSGGIATNKTQDITIYPNPTNSTIHVSINEQDVAIKIVDILGNLLMESNQKEIDVSSLANGVYFLQLASSIQKFIVQH